jgi:phage anti-repressor protein
MNTQNITSIIKNNPTTKLTNTYNNKLLEKIKDNFTNDEQCIFVKFYYIYASYDETIDFVIDLDEIYSWIGFNDKITAKRNLENNFTKNTDYKIINDKNVKKQGSGGSNIIKIMLTVDAFKSLCVLSNTSNAKNIRKYYLKIEKIIYELINEQSKEFQEDLCKEIKENKGLKINNEQLIKDKKIDHQNILLKQFGNSGALIYLIIVKTFEDGKYILKIGESRQGVQERFDEHKTKYDECLLIDCYPVKQSKNLESFVHNHELIASSKCKTLKGHENENELFLIGDKLTLAIVKDVIDKNIKMFNEYNPEIEVEKLKLEIEKIKLMKELPQHNQLNNEILEKLLSEIKELKQSNKEINDKLNSQQIKTVTGFNEVNKTLGPKLQQINPETMQLIKVYESISECIKANTNLKRSSIAKAIAENTIYQGFRYGFVDRELDCNKLHNVQPTKKTKIQNIGYIAKLSADKKTILNVYLDRKTAAKNNGYTSDSALDAPVKNFKISNGHYYVLYDSCSDELKKEFVKKNNNKEPILYITGVGQFDDKNKLLQEYVSKFECCRLLGVGDKSVKKSIEKNVLYNGKYYKYLESKVKCF